MRDAMNRSVLDALAFGLLLIMGAAAVGLLASDCRVEEVHDGRGGFGCSLRIGGAP